MNDEMTHQQVDELAGAFALGAMEPAEDAAMRSHLATCDQPHLEVYEALGAGPALAASLDPVSPSPGLRDRLMQTIERTPQRGQPEVPSSPTSRRGWLDWLSPRVARPMALAAVVALLAIGVWNANLQSELGRRDAALRAVANAIAGGEAAFRVDGTAGHGYVVETPGEGAALVVADLAKLPADKLYELWLIDAGGTPVAVGTFSRTGGAVAVISVEQDLAGFATFAVTVEAERLPAPSSSDLVMVGALE